jgi:chemotaxis protein CheX
MPAEPSSSHSFRLPAALDLGAAQDLLQQLRDGLADGGLVLDGSEVERISVPCLQVLVAARRAAGDAAAFRIVDASAALMAAVADLGLSAALPMES